MKTLIAALEKKSTAAIEQAFSSRLGKEDCHAEVASCQHAEFGHYQCNSSLKLAAQLKISPRAIAQKIVSQFDPSMFEKIQLPLLQFSTRSKNGDLVNCE